MPKPAVVERRDLREAIAEGSVSGAVAEAMTADVDARLAQLQSGTVDVPEALISPGTAVGPLLGPGEGDPA